MRIYIFVKLSILNIFPFKLCFPHKPTFDIFSDDLRKGAKYENDHRNMFATPEEYKVWPGLTSKIQMYLCEKYTEKLFKKKKKSVVDTCSTSAWMTYPQTQRINHTSKEGFAVAVLRCEILPPADGTKYIFFTRSPTNICLYLLKHRISSSKALYIAEEICEFKEYNYWHIGQMKKYEISNKFQRKRKWKTENEDKQKEYEISHMKEYLLHQDEYFDWRMEANDLCVKLLSKMLPRTNSLLLDSTYEDVKLHYTKIQKSSKTILDVIVSALKCYLPEKKRDNCFRFIKAPIQGCLYLIKCTNSKAYRFFIAKLICEQIVAVQTKGKPCLENSETKIEFHEIKIDHQYEDQKRMEYDEYENKDLAIIDKSLHHFI